MAGNKERNFDIRAHCYLLFGSDKCVFYHSPVGKGQGWLPRGPRSDPGLCYLLELSAGSLVKVPTTHENITECLYKYIKIINACPFLPDLVLLKLSNIFYLNLEFHAQYLFPFFK